MNRLEHLLVILSEECAEVQHATAKALRFGLNEKRDLPTSNHDRIRAELNDLMTVVEMLNDEGLDLRPRRVAMKNKREKVEKYLLYSKECGALES